MAIFLRVWLGQLVSAIGSRLAGFALGVWIYQQTNSITQYALILLFTYLPETLMSPLAGTFVDRWNRRQAMILSDAGAGVCTLAIVFLLLHQPSNLACLYLLLTIKAGFTTFQTLAYTAGITLLVPKQYYSRSSGMIQGAQAFAQIAAPLLAGIVVVKFGIEGALLIDVGSFLFACATLIGVKFSIPPVTVEGEVGRGSMMHEMAAGWQYIAARPGMQSLLLFLLVPYFTLGMLETLFTPLVLSFASVSELGVVLTIGGCGWLMGSICISSWSGPKRRVDGIFGFVIFQGCCLLLSGLRPSILLAATGCFGFLFAYPIVLSCNQMIWQTKVMPDLQGRVFGVRRLVEQLPPAIAYITVGPLVEHWFEPWLSPGGCLSLAFGQFLGTGAGRGISFLFVIMGALNILITVLVLKYPPLRNLEEQLPDAILITPSSQ